MRVIKGCLIAGVFLAWAVMLLMRVGYTPPASANDDVWFAEEAYWFLQDGVLRSDWHQDLLGSDVRAYYPPVSSIVQAGIFRLLGISQFSMGLAPTVFLIMTVAGMVLSLRQLHLKGAMLLLSLLPFCVPDVFRHSLFLRYEFLVVFFLMLIFVLSNVLRSRGGGSRHMAALMGVFSAMACVSYYHVAPVCMPLGLALTWLAGDAVERRVRVVWFVAGGFFPTLVFAAWIGPDWLDFLSVMRRMAASYGPPETAGQLHFVPLTMLAVWLWLSWQRISSQVGMMAVTWLVGSFLFMALQLRHHGLLPIAYLCAWCAAMLVLAERWRASATGRAEVWAHLMSACVALTALGLVFAAVLKSREPGREYAPIKAAILQAMNGRGVVVTEAAGWLALRETIGRGKLIHYQIPRPGGGPASLNASKVLLGEDPAPISTLLIRPALLEGAKTYSPALRAFLHSPDVSGPLPISDIEPYSLVMYVRRPVP